MVPTDRRNHSRFPVAVHEVLQAEEQVAAGLEDATELEGPGYLGRRREKPEHLHGVSSQPAGQH